MDFGSFFAESGTTFLWLFVAIAAAIVESMTCDLVAVWFVPGALSAMLLSVFVSSLWWQVALFLALSVLVLVLSKTVFKKYLPQSKQTKMNVDALVGAHAIVTEEIDNLHETGSVKVRSLIWTARSTENDVKIPVGSVVTVCEVAGVKLICKPQIEEENETN